VAFLALWETATRWGWIDKFFVSQPTVLAAQLGEWIWSGFIFRHLLVTMKETIIGFLLGTLLGVAVGFLFAHWEKLAHIFDPLMVALNAMPRVVLAPLFILWFGLGNTVSILIVFYAAVFPMLLNTWTGVRAVNPLWLRAAGAMGADERALFWKVIIPGASPFIITGLRQAFLRAWIAVVGAEMLAASDFGLGWVIFDSKEYLNADVMLATLLVIGLLGLGFERLVFQLMERHTVGRWGMVRTART